MVTTKPKWRKGNGNREAYRFATQKLSILTPFYNLFYREGKKVISDDLKLSPLSLAVWFMDDGSKSRSSIYLNTQQFTKDEQLKLIDLLRNQFDIDSTLNKDKIYYRIRIWTQSVKRFTELVKTFVLEEFQYKFPSVLTP